MHKKRLYLTASSTSGQKIQHELTNIFVPEICLLIQKSAKAPSFSRLRASSSWVGAGAHERVDRRNSGSLCPVSASKSAQRKYVKTRLTIGGS